jgi:molecular chaperone DnaK (HSP70)
VRLGIDFGTTHTVAAVVDRGNYPIVSFEWGDVVPSMVAARIGDGQLRFGHDALLLERDPEWVALRSLKRLVASSGPLTEVSVGPHRFRVADLLTRYLARLRVDIVERSNAGVGPNEVLTVAASVPANASNNQRFLTLDAFHQAGFDVVTLLNEPSAAGFEYAHRFRNMLTSRREYVIVYDLGGGTFDSSLIHMSGPLNQVVTSSGVSRLGGDDMDDAIAALVLDKIGQHAIDAGQRRQLLEECRLQKEAVGPNTRRMVIDLEPLGLEPLVLRMEEVYDACAPLVAATVEAMDETLQNSRDNDGGSVGFGELAGIYVVGGASSFPLVPRRLKEQFGAHRVRRSPHPFAATAIGLATYLDEGKGFELADCLTRHFGVWREADTGQAVTFDPIFGKDAPLPARGDPPLEAWRRYRSAHNIGHFRFVECVRLKDGQPDGGVVPWDEILFPIDPELRERRDLSGVAVVRSHEYDVEERYRCDAAGIFEVTVSVPDHEFARHYVIGRSSPAGVA